MKKILLLVLALANVTLFAQNTETVSVGPGYANDVYYSFANGVVKTETRSNWHLAFTTKIVDAAVWVNEGLGVQAFIASTNMNDWATLDTAGMTWDALHNSANTWAEGALNDGANGHPDYGWGTYNNITHNVTGTKIFVLVLPNGAVKKVAIDEMITNGNFTFRVANLDGTSLVTRTVNKNNYSSKNFFYYDVVNDTVIDREPNKADWDMLFTRHLEEILPSQFYPVTGVYVNNGVTASKAAGVDTTLVDWNNYTPTDSISIIGSNWKSFNNNTFTWTVDDSLSYFVNAQDGNLYKLVFKQFGGSSTGNIVFATSVASAFGVDKATLAAMNVYPNPANGFFMVEVKTDANAVVYNLAGQKVKTQNLQNGTNRMDVADLAPGIYVLTLSTKNGLTDVCRIVVN